MNNWLFIVVVGAAVTLLFLLKRLGLVSVAEARKHLQSGALVVDVRTPSEFAGGHLPGAVNIPLGEIPAGIRRHAPDQSKPLLVHCLSGGRSEIAKRQLRGLGYSQAFNLGSYARAKSIVGAQSRPV